MNPRNKSENWVLVFRIIFFLSLLPWIVGLLATPFLFDNPNTTSMAFVLVAAILAYPIIGGLLLFLGWRAGKNGNEKLATILTSIPAVIIVLLTLLPIISFTYYTKVVAPNALKEEISGQIGISFKEGTTNQDAVHIFNKYNIEFNSNYVYGPNRYFLINVQKGKEQQYVELLLREPKVKSAEYDFDYSKLTNQ